MAVWNTPPEHSRMMTAAAIASTDMGLLLRDDVFVDFFNTFLNLPVFGQTPIYISGTGQWDLWPGLSSNLDPSPTALLAWLEKHRLPHFCKSSLCLHLVLCQKLLGFIRSGEAAELLNWQSADQWLLEKCISGSQGMRHFRAFVQGTAGEELTDFWLTTERLLGLDESDTSQRDLYLSLIHRLKASHLREGSSVITLCTTITGSLPKAKHIQSIRNRRDILRKMQEQVLFTIQSYWLPKFFTHCKMGIEEEESCQPLLQEYQEHLLQADWQEPSGFLETPPTMHIKRSQGSSGPYCGQKAKAKIWALVKERRGTQEMKMPRFRVKPERQPGSARSTRESHLDKDALGSIPQQSEHPANAAFNGKGGVTPPRRPSAEQVNHLEDLCKERILSNLPSSAPPVQLPSLKGSAKTLSLLPWALSADTCAGQPFRDFLKHQDRPMETHLLDLWHDLEEFLPVVLDSSRENNFFLRHLTGDKICKSYLEEDNIEKLPLETRTLTGLWNHLIFGEFSPWIFRAQKEICKVLCCFYEEFLAADDRTFLQFMSPGGDVPVPKMQGHTADRRECLVLSQRINQTLKLCQALHGTRNLEGVSSEYWQLLASRDLQKGGSTQAEMELLLCSPDFQKMISDELAVDSPSKDDELVHLLSALLAAGPEGSVGVMKLPTAAVKKRAKRHRVKQQQWDRQQEEQEEEQLQELFALNKKPKSRRRVQRTSAVRREARNIQTRKLKGENLETENLDTENLEAEDLEAENLEAERMQWAWDAIRELVRSFCKFQREMENDERRAEFESFLCWERRNRRENLPVSSKQSKRPASTSRKGKARLENVVLVKRCIFDKEVIVVNFLVDDLHFYLEMDKFSRMADAVEALAACNIVSERKIAFLKKKVAVINNLFLDSDMPPKLRVNISEKERELIWRLSSKGPLTRAIYHKAKATIVPILMYFWKRFCTWKVMRSFRVCEEDRTFQASKKDMVAVSKKDRGLVSKKDMVPVSKKDRGLVSKKDMVPVSKKDRGRVSKKDMGRVSKKDMGRVSKKDMVPVSEKDRVPVSEKGKVPVSPLPTKTSKLSKIRTPRQPKPIPIAPDFAPGKSPVLVFSLSEGLQIQMPEPQKKTEPLEEKEDADKNLEKRPSLSK
ncbi:LOW QUALITY PROTEIN: regulator of G-protein signaling protein-like [Neopelma chrysocephalum]|uniref:LOW QUALITY PROTEIN: regulator of G-protein signaling protein-like n=1 Tax=Neopelma chrysocephalum TaxID=114329 RepID=UPI000FCD023C|nr:LOW QUALITY PROTEIN: regulator of G-protein signaling protein-like [Neopelma chrysocephalum]